MTKDIELILQPSPEAVKPKETTLQDPTIKHPKPVKIFCAERKIALALLEDLIVMAGAHTDVLNGKATEDQIKKLANNTQMFVIDLSDRLMVDCGLNEKDIDTVVNKLQRAAQTIKTP